MIILLSIKKFAPATTSINSRTFNSHFARPSSSGVSTMFQQFQRNGAALGVALLISAMAPCVALAVPMNLAPAGTATAESSKYGSVAADANDGNRAGSFGGGSVWHSEDANANLRFWQVNLGSMQYLDRIQIFPRTDPSQGSVENFRITVLDSANATIFTKDYFTSGSTNDVAWGTVDVRGLQGQTVKIERLDASPTFLTFAEFEVWGQSTPIKTNLLKGLSAANFDSRNSANASIGAGAGTANIDAADGYIDSHYSHTDAQNGGSTIGSTSPVYHTSEAGPATGGYWQVDFGQLVDIDYVNLFRRNDFLSNANSLTLQVLGADNGVPVFTQALSMGVNDLGATRYDFTIDLTNVVGRYLRIIDNDNGANAALSLAEVEVFGTVVPEPKSVALWAITGVIALLGIVLNRRRTPR
jgi:hypothetical protein